MIKLNQHTLVFVEEYIYYYSYFLSPVRYNHYTERIEARKMSQVKPTTKEEERSISRVQKSVVKAVQPLMLDVMRSFKYENTNQMVAKAVELTERTWAKQMSSAEKHQYAKMLLNGVLKEKEGSEGNLDEIIELIVMVAKNKTLVNLFKKSGKACLSCCS